MHSSGFTVAPIAMKNFMVISKSCSTSDLQGREYEAHGFITGSTLFVVVSPMRGVDHQGSSI
jgi:hypothetical protein